MKENRQYSAVCVILIYFVWILWENLFPLDVYLNIELNKFKTRSHAIWFKDCCFQEFILYLKLDFINNSYSNW